MNMILSLVVITSNILGSFNDPFEFDGDYGAEVNPVREKVFEAVVSKEALARNLTDEQVKKQIETDNVTEEELKNYKSQLITQSMERDRKHGPLFSELVSENLIQDLITLQHECKDMGFTETDLTHFLNFVECYKHQKTFYFFRNHPSEFLHLDKALKDQAAQEGKSFDLPILSSTAPLKGKNGYELKRELLHALFVENTFNLAKSDIVLKNSLKKLEPNFLQHLLGEDARNQDLDIFCTPAGQIFFYWMYQSLNLHLISEDEAMIEEINQVKDIFVNGLGNPQARATTFREKLIAANAGIVFTQESDAFVPEALSNNNLFLPIERQNPQDGSFVFLRTDLWDANYEIIPIEGYEGYEKGKINLILATLTQTKEKFLLASSHGNSTKAEDGRLQIRLVAEKFQQLSLQHPNLQLLIGIDANTKNEEDVKALRELLDSLGLIGTNVGPTTVKKRMVTAQHAKAGKFAIDEEDYLITLKPENGGHFEFDRITVGFSEEKPDITATLPNKTNSSDHYPVGATLRVLDAIE